MLGYLGYAWRNARRRPVRSFAVAGALAALAVLLLTTTAFYVSVENSVWQGSMRLGADVMVVPKGTGGGSSELLLAGVPAAAYLPEGAPGRVLSAEGVAEAAPQLFVTSADLPCCSVADTMLVGFDPEADFTIMPWAGGGSLVAAGSNHIIVGSRILNEEGGRLSFFSRLFTVKSRLEPTGLRYFDSTVFMHMEDAYSMMESSGMFPSVPEDAVSSVLVRVEGGYDPAKVALELQLELPGADVVTAGEAIRGARAMMLSPLRALFAAGVFHFIMSMVLVGIVVSASLSERTREFGLLRALGASERDVLRMVIAETVVLAGSGALIGVLSGAFLWDFARDKVFPDLMVPGPGAIILAWLSAGIFVLIALSALLASLPPVIRASRVRAFDSLLSRAQGE
jgi:putative ABC transport system permease protein